MFATDLRNHIQELEAERMYASLEGLATDPIYPAARSAEQELTQPWH
jgi:hypothetical protein